MRLRIQGGTESWTRSGLVTCYALFAKMVEIQLIDYFFSVIDMPPRTTVSKFGLVVIASM